MHVRAPVVLYACLEVDVRISNVKADLLSLTPMLNNNKETRSIEKSLLCGFPINGYNAIKIPTLSEETSFSLDEFEQLATYTFP